jgi:hypothetical protein
MMHICRYKNLWYILERGFSKIPSIFLSLLDSALSCEKSYTPKNSLGNNLLDTLYTDDLGIVVNQ